MSYTPNTPVTGDSLGSTRDIIRTNFQQIDTVNSINHVAFNEANQGKHKFLQMPEQSSNPTTAADEGALFAKVGAGPTETALYFRAESDGTVYQLTRVDSTKTATFATNTNYQVGPPSINGGWTFLPGGMLLQYGLLQVSASGTATVVTFPKSYTNTPYSITIGSVTGEGNSPGANNQFVKDGTVATTGFSIVNSSGSAARKVYWMSIGV